MDITFDDLISAIDEDSNIIIQFQSFMKSELDKQSIFITNTTDDKKKS